MAKKRKQPYDSPSSTDHQSNGNNAPSSQSKVDPAYGQRSAFPGLDGAPASDEISHNDGGDEDALSYLRMVRNEANALPNLFVAPKRPEPTQPILEEGEEEDGEIHDNEDSTLYADYPQGYYSDGAYTALPDPTTITSSSHNHANFHLHQKHQPPTAEEDTDIHPQTAHSTALLTRFHTLHTTLSSPPTPPTPTNKTAHLLSTTRKPSLYRRHLLKFPPSTYTLSQLPQESVIFALEIFTDLLTPGNLRRGEQGRNLGAWGWGLLGRCRGLGEMGSLEVSVVRDVGKAAGWCLRRVVVDGGVGAGRVEGRQEVGLRDQDEDEDDKEEGGEEDGEVTDFEEGYEMEDTEPGAQDPKLADEGTRDDEDAIRAAQERLLTSIKTSGEVGNAIPQTTNDAADPLTSNTAATGPDPTPAVDTAGSHPNTSPETAAETAAETSRSEIIATLDMLITIVGEVYGQRDLLDSRISWDDMPFS